MKKCKAIELVDNKPCCDDCAKKKQGEECCSKKAPIVDNKTCSLGRK